MPEPGGESSKPPHQNAERYIKPTLPFYQQEFDGPIHALPEDVRLGVLSIYERTTDKIIDDVQAKHATGVKNVYEEVLEDDGSTLECAYITGSDGREVGVRVNRRADRFVTWRDLSIDWDVNNPDMSHRHSSYHVEYDSDVLPIVRREDIDDQPVPFGSSLTDLSAHDDKVDAHHAAAEAGFNDQPIRIREAQGLQDYLGIPH